jgi:hypothetical protein
LNLATQFPAAFPMAHGRRNYRQIGMRAIRSIGSLASPTNWESLASISPVSVTSEVREINLPDFLSTLQMWIFPVGANLLEMNKEDFQLKYPNHGHKFYEAFRQLVHQIQIQQQHSPAIIEGNANDLLGLQSMSVR